MKNLRPVVFAGALALAAAAPNALAQTVAAQAAVPANVGATNVANVLSYTAGANVNNFTITTTVGPDAARATNIRFQAFDGTAFVDCDPLNPVSPATGTEVSCNNANGRFVVARTSPTAVLANLPQFGRILINVPGTATAGTVPVAFGTNCATGQFPTSGCSEFLDSANARVNGTLTNGSYAVTLGPQPRYTSTPAPGAAVLITDAIGGGASSATLTVTNSGLAGAGALTLSAIGGLSGVLGITPAAPVNIAQGANQAFTISCNAAAVGDTVQTLSITHNGEAAGGGAASPVTHQVTCRGVNVDTPPTVSLGAAVQPPAGAINLNAAGSVPVNVDSAGAPTASVTLNCSFAAPGLANFQVTAGGTRTINAPATTGPNAPAVAVQCTRQSAAATATLSCARTTVPASSLAPLTVDFTCPAGTTAPNPGVNPPSGSTVAFSGPPASVVSNGLTFTNTGGTAAYNVTACTLGGASPASYAVTGTFPVAVVAGGSANVGLTCTTPPSPGAPVTATLTCETNVPGAVPFAPTFNLTCQSLVLAVPAMGWGGKALMILLVLGFGLVGFQLYRRTA
jgi:hypothetical protein